MQQFIANGHLSGYGDGQYRPNNSITRSEFIKLVNRYLNYTTKGQENFTDVSAQDWFYNEVCIAQNQGYINGRGDGTFKPNDRLTREEAAKILVTVSEELASDTNKINKFEDIGDISPWAKQYMEDAVELGLLNGNDKNELKPKSNITRAESVVMLYLIKFGSRKRSTNDNI